MQEGGAIFSRLGRANSVALCVGAVLLLASAIPIFCVDYLPLHDYPNHITRAAIIARWGELGAQNENYIIGGFLLPNIVADILILAIGQVVSINMAGKIVIVISLLACVAGTIAINCKFNNEISIVGVLASFMIFNGILIWGFVNYILGVGLTLIGLASWIFIANFWIRLIVGSVFSIVILLSHLIAFGIYALCIFCYEVGRLQKKNISIVYFFLSGAQFILPLAIFFATRTTGSGYRDFRYVDHPFEKLPFIAKTFITYVPMADLAFLLAGIIFIFLLATKAISISLDRRMWGPVIVCGLAFLLLPFSFFGSYFLDARIPLVLTFIVLAAVRVRVRNSRMYRLGLGLLATLVLFRVVAIADEWRKFDARYHALDFTVIEPGAALFTATGPKLGLADQYEGWRPPLAFAASYASLSGTFVPAMFADPRHQPLYASPAVSALYRFQGNLPYPVDDQDAVLAFAGRIRNLSHFRRNYLLILRCDRLGLREEPALTVVLRTDRECLLRIN